MKTQPRGLASALLFTTVTAQAFDWTSSDVQYLHGTGYLLGSKTRDLVTLEHADGWAYGQNFMFVDVIAHEAGDDPVPVEAYGEIYSYLSFGKLAGRRIGYGPVKDLGVTLGFNAGSEPSAQPFRAYLGGASVQLDIPFFQFLQVDVLAYKNERLAATAFQITPAWELPFRLGPLDFRFRGFMDYISAGGNGAAETVLAQPQLLLDVGAFAGAKNQLLFGVEYQFWHNKFGLKGVNEGLPQAMGIFRF